MMTVPIRGMHCASCELLIGEQIKKLPGVSHVRVNYKKGQADVHWDRQRPSDADIAQAVQEAGYEVGAKDKLPWISTTASDYRDLARAAVALFIVYLIARELVFLFDIDASGTPASGVAVALFVGLVAGVSTCMALVGGLVLGLAARHAELHPEATVWQKFRPHLFFNAGRIGGYALFGGSIGLLGQAFRPSSNLLGFLTMLIGGVMIFFGLKLVEIFPILRDKIITLPSSVARWFGLHRETKEYSHKSAVVAGALTFFVPCGFTQAMQLYALSTGSFGEGMAIMGLFALGTAPGLLGVGGLTSVVRGRGARVFFMAAGLAVIILGWINVANGRHLLTLRAPSGGTGTASVDSGDVQVVRMTQGSGGYSPNTLTVRKGKPVKWIINSTSSFTCAAFLVMPSYGVSQALHQGENVITFTPTETGEIPFSCSMGMYRGTFIVVN